MKKKKFALRAILLTILTSVVIVVGFVSNIFFGNPISKFIAKNNYKKYIEETYPNSDFKVTKAIYNFKYGNYGAEVVSKEKNITFRVSERYDNVILDDYRDSPKYETNQGSIYNNDYDKANELMLQSEIEKSIKGNRILQDLYVHNSMLDGSSSNIELSMKILKKTKPSKEELAKETYEIKELIKTKYPEIKYLSIDYYEYTNTNPKGGNWGQYYGSIFIGNEFAPWSTTEVELSRKLKVSETL